jgi:hypothetical protein
MTSPVAIESDSARRCCGTRCRRRFGF